MSTDVIGEPTSRKQAIHHNPSDAHQFQCPTEAVFADPTQQYMHTESSDLWHDSTHLSNEYQFHHYTSDELAARGGEVVPMQQWIKAQEMIPMGIEYGIPGYVEPRQPGEGSISSPSDGPFYQSSTISPSDSSNDFSHQAVLQSESMHPVPMNGNYFDLDPFSTSQSMAYPGTTMGISHVEAQLPLFDSQLAHFPSSTTGEHYVTHLPTSVQFPSSLSPTQQLPDTAYQRIVPTTNMASAPIQLKHSDKIGTTRIRKANPKQKNPKTSTALLVLPKSQPVSRQTSCWRCRRYKKPCTGKGSVCDACVTSGGGFRIWSSEIGCKRGDMNEFILMLIPTDVERNSIKIDTAYIKPPSFRQSSKLYPSATVIPISATKGDAWDQFLYKIQSTEVQGPGVMELLQIAVRYQRKIKKPDKVIVGAARAMSTAAELFKLLVATKGSDEYTSKLDLAKVFIEARRVLTSAASQFLRNCLTGRIKQWFPTFIAAIMNVWSFIMIGDAIAAIPLHYRAAVWPDVRKSLLSMREALYPTATSLLTALSKGSQPLNMSCWVVQETSRHGIASKWTRNPEGMRLVDDCEATFDAMSELQQWREDFMHLLQNDQWMSNQPLVKDLLLIKSVARMFLKPES